MSKLADALQKVYNAANKSWKGDDWNITITPDGITINDGIDDLVDCADSDEAAEAFTVSEE